MAMMDGEEMDMLKARAEAYDEMRKKVEALDAKCDQLIAENDELRMRLEMPNGWTADTAPTYRDLATAFVLANKEVEKLHAELFKYHYHSNEQGRKKPTYNEWMGEAVRLKELVDEQNRVIEDLSRRLSDQEGQLKEPSDGPEGPETGIQK